MLKSFLKWMSDNNLVNLDDIAKDDDDGFKARFNIQKCVFVAQHFGLGTNYLYNRYKHGPYSPSLTKDYYAFAEDGLEDDGLEVNYDKEACLDVVKNRDKNWMEIATTIMYMCDDNNADKKSLVRDVASVKILYSEEYIQSVFDDMLKTRLGKVDWCNNWSQI